jgi:hypothetical protein
MPNYSFWLYVAKTTFYIKGHWFYSRFKIQFFGFIQIFGAKATFSHLLPQDILVLLIIENLSNLVFIFLDWLLYINFSKKINLIFIKTSAVFSYLLCFGCLDILIYREEKSIISIIHEK